MANVRHLSFYNVKQIILNRKIVEYLSQYFGINKILSRMV